MKFTRHTVPNALHALWNVLLWLWHGDKPINVSVDEYVARVGQCYACKYYAVGPQQCTLCTCYVPWKAKLRTESCPDSRWPVL